MKAPVTTIGLTLASVFALSQAGLAQESGQQQSAQDSQCMERLNSLAQQMNEDGYWLSGYTGYGVDRMTGAYGRGGAWGRPPTAAAPGAAGGTAPAVDGDAAQARGPAADRGPWGDMAWQVRPQYEIRTLYRAANVLAGSGNEEACMTVVDAAEGRYENYVSQLEEHGVDPQEITTWRQAQIATAVPVNETEFPRRIDDVLGADVRNVQDEDLGDIQDVVFDPQSREIQYAIVSRGGFFGIGSEEVAVPWDHLQIAAGTFVLPVNEQAMEQAPQVQRQNLAEAGQSNAAEEVDSYWDNAIDQ